MAPSCQPRGDAKKGGKAKAKVLKRQASESDDPTTLYGIYTKDRELFETGQEYIGNFVSKNVSWEVQKAIAILIMTSAMTELGKGIVDAAKQPPFSTRCEIDFSNHHFPRAAILHFREYIIPYLRSNQL